MSKNRRHGVRINMNPQYSEKIYEGKVNGNSFTISHIIESNGQLDDDFEYDETVDVLWDSENVPEKKLYTTAIKKIFKNKLNAGTQVQ